MHFKRGESDLKMTPEQAKRMRDSIPVEAAGGAYTEQVLANLRDRVDEQDRQITELYRRATTAEAALSVIERHIKLWRAGSERTVNL